VRVTAAAVWANLDSEGAGNLPWTRVADASLVEEMLQKSKQFRWLYNNTNSVSFNDCRLQLKENSIQFQG